jgi:hypothetical protein
MREQFPPQLRSVEDVANRLLADRDAPGWTKMASGIVKCHQELSTRFAR